MNIPLQKIKFDEHGLIPAIVQDAHSRQVLTLAYMNAESIARTTETEQTWFWSRSRNELWHKGETSGNTQQVVDLKLDCDGDAIVVLVQPAGPACHTGATSCFDNAVEEDRGGSPKVQSSAVATNLGTLLNELYCLIKERQRERPPDSYTTYLFNEGIDKILKKIGEESAETIVAAKNEPVEPLVAEVSDLLYHVLVLLVARGVTLESIHRELAGRRSNGGR